MSLLFCSCTIGYLIQIIMTTKGQKLTANFTAILFYTWNHPFLSQSPFYPWYSKLWLHGSKVRPERAGCKSKCILYLKYRNASELYLRVIIPLCWLLCRNQAKKQIHPEGISAGGSGSLSGFQVPVLEQDTDYQRQQLSLWRRTRAPGSPGDQAAKQQGWHIPCCGSSACSWLVNPARVVDPTDGESCVPRDSDLTLPQHLSATPKMAEGCSVPVTCTRARQLEKGGNVWSKVHLWILGQDMAAYHEVL